MPGQEYPPSKSCRTCGEVKPLTEFYKHQTGKDGHRNDCKPCRRKKQALYVKENYETIRAGVERVRQETREYLVACKDKPCTDCGQRFPHWAMDFHHTRDKEQLVSRLVQAGYNKEKVKAEIAKCVLLCATCHRLRHGPPKFGRAA